MRKLLSGIAIGLVMGLVLTGTAYAATGGTFVLGRSNAASTQTLLTNSGTGPVLALSTKPGQVPLAVSAHSGKASNLNADKLDGLDVSALQRRTSETCTSAEFMAAIDADGSVVCAGVLWAFPAVEGAIPENGYVRSDCPQGWTSVGGSYVPPPQDLAVPVMQLAYQGGDGIEGFVVRLVDFVDGSPYEGPVDVVAHCTLVANGGSGVSAQSAQKPLPPS